jgi:hypothetical protein
LKMIIVTHRRAVQPIGEGVGSYCATAHAARDHGRNRSNMTLGRDQSRIGANARADRPHNLLPNCLGRCSFCPLLVVMHVSSARRRTTDRRAAHGNGTAFSAVAPSKRPIFAAHRSNIREWYCPQARIAGHSTSQLIVRFQPAPRLSVGETALGYECGAFATYRPVSCASTSTICRCITACARRYSQLAALPLDPSELSSRCRCCFHGHSHHNATGSLNP